MDMAIDQVWSLKEEPCRANNWKSEEVVALLNTIKRNNLMKGCPSSNQLGQLIEPLLGYSRTAFQITGKLKNLRKSYLTCEKKGCTPLALKECPYYELLAEIYGNEGDDDSDINNATNNDIIKDIKVSSERGIEKMLGVIKDLNLAPDLTLQSFSPGAIRLISKMLIARGVCATTEQVKLALMDLRKMYIEYRHNCRSNKIFSKNMNLEYLHSLWGSMSIPDVINDTNVAITKPKIEPNIVKDKGDYWSEEETIVLLTSIKTLNLTDEALKNSEESARKLKDALKDSGYMRSKYQIQRRLDNLQNNYLNAQQAKTLDEAIRKFSFYSLYESIFNSSDFSIPDFSTSEAIDQLNAREQQDEYDDDDTMMLTSEKIKHSRSRSWSDDETILMLTLLNDLNLARLIAHRLSFEITCKLVEPMREQGYTRSAMQIQIKLRNLRKSYYRCIRAGNTKKAIADCPFYDKLNAIFRQPKQRKLRTVRKLEQIDANFTSLSESFSDHSYSNAAAAAAAGRIEKLRKLPKIEREESDDNSSEVWLPVETICDESVEDRMSVHEEEDASGFEEIDETEMRASNDDEDVENDKKDPLEDVDNDTGQKNCGKNSTSKNCSINKNRVNETCSDESPGPSRKSPEKLDPSWRIRGPKRASTKSLDTKSKKVSPALKSMRIVMAEVLRHEKLLQRQHHAWMERQFEIQRKHDREQRELLINELKEFRKAVTSAKVSVPENSQINIL